MKYIKRIGETDLQQRRIRRRRAVSSPAVKQEVAAGNLQVSWFGRNRGQHDKRGPPSRGCEDRRSVLRYRSHAATWRVLNNGVFGGMIPRLKTRNFQGTSGR